MRSGLGCWSHAPADAPRSQPCRTSACHRLAPARLECRGIWFVSRSVRRDRYSGGGLASQRSDIFRGNRKTRILAARRIRLSACRPASSRNQHDLFDPVGRTSRKAHRDILFHARIWLRLDRRRRHRQFHPFRRIPLGRRVGRRIRRPGRPAVSVDIGQDRPSRNLFRPQCRTECCVGAELLQNRLERQSRWNSPPVSSPADCSISSREQMRVLFVANFRNS